MNGLFSTRGKMRTTPTTGGYMCRYYSFLGDLLFSEYGRTRQEAEDKIKPLRLAHNAKLKAEKKKKQPALLSHWRNRTLPVLA